MRRNEIRVVGELPLERQHRRHAVAPVPLRRRQDPHLVVDEDVPLGGVPALHVVELFLLVDVDENAVDDRRQTRARDLPRLEDRVAVREDDGRARVTQPREHVERMRVEAVGERVLEQVLGNGEQPRIPALRLPPLLHRAEVVAIPELHEAALLDRPVRGARIRTVRHDRGAARCRPDPVVVEQRVVRRRRGRSWSARSPRHPLATAS